MEVSLIIKNITDKILTFILLPYVFFAFIIISFILLINSNKIFFKQKRAGKDCKGFYIYKFKTISSAGKSVLRFGKFLRNTHLDEIPQFFNVLKSDMSLVGPRPEIYTLAKKYNKHQIFRLSVKPGLTGLWQISPYTDLPINSHLEYDFYYIKNKSFLKDLFIIAETCFLIIRKIINSKK
jgi:lipopolysaccharide/colanic/teichoic acid biosynthesis glycosyltransferase